MLLVRVEDGVEPASVMELCCVQAGRALKQRRVQSHSCSSSVVGLCRGSLRRSEAVELLDQSQDDRGDLAKKGLALTNSVSSARAGEVVARTLR